LKEQRLQLEFKSVVLSDIQLEINGFHPSDSVWMVMQKTQKHSKSGKRISAIDVGILSV